MKPQGLKLHGKAFDPATLTDQTEKVRLYLNTAPKDTLYDSPEIIGGTNIAESTLANCRIALVRDGYALRVGRTYLYGNKAAIAELKRRLGE